MDLSNLITLWNFFVGFYLVYADVTRDDWYNDYGGLFTVVHKGRMLRVLMFFNNVEVKVCAIHCVRHLRCRTFNYHNGRKDCELTDEDFNKMNADTITRGWYNFGKPTKVDGAWSGWRNFTDCTKSCGSGTLEQYRECDSPKPNHAGTDCEGRMRRRVECNTQECPVVNVALGRTATQSSTVNSPLSAIDGLFDTYSCTLYHDYPWWEISLGEEREIKYLHLHAFVHQYANRGLFVETRKMTEASWTMCRYIGDVTQGVTKFKCNGILTNVSFLRIRSETKCRLYFFEVEIFGY